VNLKRAQHFKESIMCGRKEVSLDNYKCFFFLFSIHAFLLSCLETTVQHRKEKRSSERREKKKKSLRKISALLSKDIVENAYLV
jgi:membrane protein implicated in regulation of membrane protease activity